MNADTEGSITIIGISNNGVVEEQMSPKVTSRFGREHIKFSKYNAIQLRKILERRKDNAFQSGAVADGVVAKTAAAMANDGGDAREAIEVYTLHEHALLESTVVKGDPDDPRDLYIAFETTKNGQTILHYYLGCAKEDCAAITTKADHVHEFVPAEELFAE